jgi:outer membrane receptor protein involved in Fe transport
MPTPTELWGTSAWYDPNPGLKAEASKTWEVGLDVSWEFVTAGLTYFHSKWDNKIIGQQIPGDRYRMVNLTGATIAGWELALSADLGQAFQRDFQLRPYVNFTYLPTRRNDDHSDSPNSATRLGFDTLTNTSKMTLAYGLDFDHPGWDLTANVNVNYAGEKLTQDWSDPAAGPAPWIKNTPGAIVDMSLEKGLVEFKDKGRLKGRLEINNLLDKYDEAYISYPGPGRNFYVGLVYEY